MSWGQVVYTLHLWPPLGHAGHYTRPPRSGGWNGGWPITRWAAVPG